MVLFGSLLDPVVTARMGSDYNNCMSLQQFASPGFKLAIVFLEL